MDSGILFDREKYEKLRKQYDLAVEKDEPEFVFEGYPVLTSYAKYLLECLALKFGKEE